LKFPPFDAARRPKRTTSLLWIQQRSGPNKLTSPLIDRDLLPLAHGLAKENNGQIRESVA